MVPFLFQTLAFNKTVLKIEADDISALDVSIHLDELQANLLLRKEEEYLAPAAFAEKKSLDDDGYDVNIITETFRDFYGKL